MAVDYSGWLPDIYGAMLQRRKMQREASADAISREHTQAQTAHLNAQVEAERAKADADREAYQGYMAQRAPAPQQGIQSSPSPLQPAPQVAPLQSPFQPPRALVKAPETATPAGWTVPKSRADLNPHVAAVDQAMNDYVRMYRANYTPNVNAYAPTREGMKKYNEALAAFEKDVPAAALRYSEAHLAREAGAQERVRRQREEAAARVEREAEAKRVREDRRQGRLDTRIDAADLRAQTLEWQARISAEGSAERENLRLQSEAARRNLADVKAKLAYARANNIDVDPDLVERALLGEQGLEIGQEPNKWLPGGHPVVRGKAVAPAPTVKVREIPPAPRLKLPSTKSASSAQGSTAGSNAPQPAAIKHTEADASTGRDNAAPPAKTDAASNTKTDPRPVDGVREESGRSASPGGSPIDRLNQSRERRKARR